MTDKLRALQQRQAQSSLVSGRDSRQTSDLSSSLSAPDAMPQNLPLLTRGLAGVENVGAGDRLLNSYELRAITHFIVYVAETQKISENTVCAIVAARFDVAEVRAIPARFYNQVMDCLLDFDAARILN